MAYLKQVPRVSGAQLEALIAGKAIPPELAGRKPQPEATRMHSRNGNGREFRILEYIKTKLRKVGRNYVTRCPSCAEGGHDRSGDNLAISIEDPRKYICWAGCRKDMIREALGCPISLPAVGLGSTVDKEFERPDWTPLGRLVGNRCCEFMWMWRQGGVGFYKHINARRYLLLDSEGGCYRQTAAGLEAVDVTAELKRVRGG